MRFHLVNTNDKRAWILELNAVVKHTDCGMHRAEIIGVGTQVDQSLTQAIELRVVLIGKSAFPCHKRIINIQT